MPMADAVTPEPVYGIRIASRSPWTQPSSPQRPWSALKATAIRSARSRAASSGSTSTRTASYPFSWSAFAMAAPVLSDTSRSDDWPP